MSFSSTWLGPNHSSNRRFSQLGGIREIARFLTTVMEPLILRQRKTSLASLQFDAASYAHHY
jgi:hypothetical protein